MGRILIFTGKGGVGKTSVAAAHAAASAREGKRTLLVSTDMAHNLGDIFETEVGGHAREVREHLSLLELDPELLMREEFPNVNRALTSLFGSRGNALGSAEDAFMIPGFENLFSLLKIKEIYESGVYERIIVDCAPTGETLALLKLPELLSWYMEKFFPVGKAMVRVLTPISKLKYKVTLPDHRAMDEVEEMHAQMLSLQELLKDSEICTVRLVCVPEKMVVEETKRNFMYLNLYGYAVDGVFINRVLPKETGSAFMDHWRDIQRDYIEELYNVFADIPTTKIPWYARELRGEEALETLTDLLCEKPDLFAIRPCEARETYETISGGYRLCVRLPGVQRENVHVTRHGLDLDIQVSGQDRRIPLPNTLREAELSAITFSEETLFIYFRESEKEGKDVRKP